MVCESDVSPKTGRDGLIRLSGYRGNPAETDLLRALITEFNASQRDVEAIYEPVPGQYYSKLRGGYRASASEPPRGAG